MSAFLVQTEVGDIKLRFLPEAAPQTADYISKLVQNQLYDGTSFYRSDFVIQFGTHGISNKTNPLGPLQVNETSQHKFVSNTRGTVAVAHFDVPDCGGSEIFINLNDNQHLDGAYGGFCVFATVDPNDTDSFKTVDTITTTVKQKGKVIIHKAVLVP